MVLRRFIIPISSTPIKSLSYSCSIELICMDHFFILYNTPIPRRIPLKNILQNSKHSQYIRKSYTACDIFTAILFRRLCGSRDFAATTKGKPPDVAQTNYLLPSFCHGLASTYLPTTESRQASEIWQHTWLSSVYVLGTARFWHRVLGISVA